MSQLLRAEPKTKFKAIGFSDEEEVLDLDDDEKVKEDLGFDKEDEDDGDGVLEKDV